MYRGSFLLDMQHSEFLDTESDVLNIVFLTDIVISEEIKITHNSSFLLPFF